MKTAALAIHLIAAAVFAGGLAFLGVTGGIARAMLDERARIEFFRRVGRRFAVVGGAALAVLVATGTYMATVDLASIDDFTTTPFGHILLVKLILVAVVIALTAIHSAVQGPGVRRLRERALERPGDRELEALVRRRQRRSTAVSSLLLLATIAILVQAARLAT